MNVTNPFLYALLTYCLIMSSWVSPAMSQEAFDAKSLARGYDFLVYVQPVNKHTEPSHLEIVYSHKGRLFSEKKQVQKLYFDEKYFLFSAFQLEHLIKTNKPNCLFHSQLTESPDFAIIYYQVAGMELKHGDIYDIHSLDRRITCLKSLHAWTLKYGAKAKHKLFRKVIATINRLERASETLRSEGDFLQDLKDIILRQSELRVIPINRTYKKDESNGYINRHLQHLIEESAIELARYEGKSDRERRLLELQYETLNNELRELKLIEKDLSDGTNYTGQAYVPIEIYDENETGTFVPEQEQEQDTISLDGLNQEQIEKRDEEAAEELNDFLGD